MKKHDVEIMKALKQLKAAHFGDILKQVNLNRQIRYPKQTLRNTMSPTTLNHELKFLVRVKAVKRVETNRKNITYEPLITESRTWYEGGFVEGMTLSLQTLRFDLTKFPPFFGLTGILFTLSAEELRCLHANLAMSVEMLTRFIDSNPRKKNVK